MNVKHIALTLGLAATCMAFINCSESGTNAKQKTGKNGKENKLSRPKKEGLRG